MRLCSSVGAAAAALSALLLAASAAPPSNSAQPRQQLRAHDHRSTQLRNWFIVETSTDQVVNRGDVFALFARVDDGEDDPLSNDDWKVCTWRRTSDARSCRTEYKCDGTFCGIGVGNFYHETTCDGELSDTSFFGEDPNSGNKMCGIRVPDAGPEDGTDWRVTLEECLVTGCGSQAGNGVMLSATVNVRVNN